uniref:Type III effector protein n=1 Tax=Streptomyces sp. NBC_01393 TaxID=2903851 RepID=A0AAU3I7R1_9ACTN
MNIDGITALTSHFKGRLSPLQFPAKRSVEQRLTSLERGGGTSGKQPAAPEPAAPTAAAQPSATRPGRSRAGSTPSPVVGGRSRANTPKPADPDAHFNQVMARSAGLLQRTAPPGTRSFAGGTPSPSTGARSRAGGTPSPAVGGRSRASSGPAPGSDAHFDAVMSRSANLLAATRPQQGPVQQAPDALQRIRDTAAAHRAWAPLPEERLEDRAKSLEATHGRVRAEARLNTGGAPAPTASAPVRPAPKPKASAQKSAPAPVTPVKSPQQFDQSNFAPAAMAAPRPARTYTAPETVVQAAPQHSPVRDTRGSQKFITGLPSLDKLAQGKAVAPRAEESPERTPAGPGEGQMSFDDLAPKPRARRQAAPAKRAQRSPKQASVSGDDWNAMLNDSVAEHKASKAAKAPAPAKTPGVRETTLSVGGKKHVVRTEHSGTPRQLETQHTSAVKAKLAELRAPGQKKAVAEAEGALNSAKANGANKTTVAERQKELNKAKRGPQMSPQHSESFREAYKKHAKVKYDTEVPEHLKPFMGKGSDDPGKSHYYGLGKK